MSCSDSTPTSSRNASTPGDTSRPNATSIACIAKYDNKRVLLLADAPTEAVIAGLQRLGGPHRFSAVKLSHHGSQHNTNLELCKLISSKRWLVSTNGAVFEHPDPESLLARIVTTQDKPELMFNYVTEFIDDVVRGAGQRYTSEASPNASRTAVTARATRCRSDTACARERFAGPAGTSQRKTLMVLSNNASDEPRTIKKDRPASLGGQCG